MRFGSLSLQKQVHYEHPKPDMWPSSPPCKKGFFAFPAGYVDPFYLPLSRPPEEPYSLLQYLRDDDGNKVTKRDLYDPACYEDEDYYEFSSHYHRYYYTRVRETKLGLKGRELLKKRKLKISQILWVERPSWVMVYPNPRINLLFYGLDMEWEDRSRLSQPVEYLLDPSGEKLDAREIFSGEFFNTRFPDMYETWYESPVAGRDIFPDDKELHYPDGRTITLAKWLKKKNILVEQLCLWPCYAEDDDVYAATMKKYRVFDYEGCLWHHLGMLLKPSEILGRFSDTWYYTDIHAYERALRKSNGKTFGKKREYQRTLRKTGYYAAMEYNGTFDKSKMYEVFFDQRIP